MIYLMMMIIWVVVNAWIVNGLYQIAKEQDEELQSLRKAFQALIDYTDKERDFVQEALRDARRTVR